MADPVSEFSDGGGAISVIYGSQVSLRGSILWKKWNILHNTAVTKQWTAKWLYIVNAVFQIAQNHGEKVFFVGCREDDRPNRASLESSPADVSQLNEPSDLSSK